MGVYFIPCRSSSGDDADFCGCGISFGPEVSDRQHRAVAGATNGKPALLVFAVLQIGDSKELGIVEHGARKFERNAMLTSVRICLRLVPVKLILPLIHNPSSPSILCQAIASLVASRRVRRRLKLRIDGYRRRRGFG